jgi:vacuolar-type H+-ATPase subunit E/Vma4
VALSDIIKRIEADTAAEVERILAEADESAAQALAAARSEASEQASRIRAQAERDADIDAATRLAGVRLAVRDEALVARRLILDEALEALVAAVEALPAAEYARFLGAQVASGVRTGDSIALGADDASLADAVRAAVEATAPDVELAWSPEPAPFARGALVSGTRTHIEVTPRSVIESRRETLEIELAHALFGDGEG